MRNKNGGNTRFNKKRSCIQTTTNNNLFYIKILIQYKKEGGEQSPSSFMEG